jgi:hypothetical protein
MNSLEFTAGRVYDNESCRQPYYSARESIQGLPVPGEGTSVVSRRFQLAIQRLTNNHASTLACIR